MLLKKTDYDKLTAKLNNIDTSDLMLKTINIKQAKQEQKIEFLILVVLLKKQTILKLLIQKIPDIITLATKTALTTVENKIANVSNLVKKTDCNTKITEIENKINNHNHDKYIDTQEFNKLAADVFNARLAKPI